MGLRYQRHLGSPTTLDPGQYTKGVDGRVIVACAICDATTRIDDTHEIDRAGRVTPRFVCPSCPMMEFIELDSFGEEVAT